MVLESFSDRGLLGLFVLVLVATMNVNECQLHLLLDQLVPKWLSKGQPVMLKSFWEAQRWPQSTLQTCSGWIKSLKDKNANDLLQPKSIKILPMPLNCWKFWCFLVFQRHPICQAWSMNSNWISSKPRASMSQCKGPEQPSSVWPCASQEFWSPTRCKDVQSYGKIHHF